MSSKRSSGVSEAATKVDAKRKGNLTVMTKGGTKKSNTYYFALGETALYYFTSDAADRPKGEYKLNSFSSCTVLDEKKCVFELSSPVKSIYLKVDSKESLGSWVTLINECISSGKSTTNLLARQGRVEYNAYLKGTKLVTPVANILVWEAKGVADGAQDMFVTVAGNGVEMSRSEVIWQTTTPRWYHECDLGFERPIESVLISMYDIRKKGNVHIGHVLLTPEHLKNDLEQPEWFPIEKRIDDITMSLEISKTGTNFNVKIVSVTGLTTAKGVSWTIEIKGDGNTVATSPPSSDGLWGSTFTVGKPQNILLLLTSNTGEQVGKVEISTANDECCGSNEWEVSGPVVGQLRLTWKSSTIIVLGDEKYDPLFALMVENEMDVVKMISICKGVEQTGAMSKHFTLAFEMRRTAAHFIKALIEDEIARTTQPSTIFRGNSLATKSLDYFMKMTAMPALHHILKPIIAEIYKGKRSCELDARRLEEPNPKDAEKKIKKNVENVVYYCNQILNASRTIPKILPLTLRNIFCEMRKHLTKKWPDHPTVKYSGPSGFIFLRFICPAILGPTIFGLSNDHASCTVARDLMLIAKSVQNLANLRGFGEKEPFMCPMNEFIEKHFDVMKGLLDEISTPPTSPIDEIPKTHLNINFGKEMAQVTSYFSHNYPALIEVYGSDNPSLAKLQQVLDLMDEEKKNIADPTGSMKKTVASTAATPTNEGAAPLRTSSGGGVTLSTSNPSSNGGHRSKRRSIVLMNATKGKNRKGDGPEENAPQENESSGTGETQEEAKSRSSRETPENRIRALEEENAKLKERIAELERINAELSSKH